MSAQYYSAAFPTMNYPSNKKVFSYDKDDFQKVLDNLLLLVDIKNGRKFFKKPMSILVAQTEEKIVCAINFDKSTFGNTLLSTMKGIHAESSVESEMRNASLEEEGLNVNIFFRLRKDSFNKIFPIMLKIFNESQNLSERIRKLFETNASSSELQDCIDSVRKGINNTIINYGGNGMWVDPRFQARNIVIKPNQGFYVLPFEDGPKNAMSAIKDEILRQKLDCELIKSEDRFDPTRGNNIVENIWQDICASRFIVADISNRNPNVFYELGICDTLGKNVITLCSQDSLARDYKNHLPFDIATQYTIMYREDYEGYKKMSSEVVKRIEAILQTEGNIERK